MVVIKSCYTVAPAEPTLDGLLPLSDCDQSKMWSLTPSIYVYTPVHSLSFSQVVETLKVSLSRALVPFYPLAGRLHWIGGGRLELVCNDMGAEFVVAESESTLKEFGVFDVSDKMNPLLPLIDYDLPIEKRPVMSVRVTGFACGGITIGLAVSHTVADGASAMHFIRSWTKLARGKDLDVSDAPCHDRSVLMSSSPPSPPRQTLDISVEWKPLPLLLGRVDVKEEQEKETAVATLKLTKEQVEGLRKQANEVDKETQESGNYSRFESISAHVWRSACRARGHEYEQPTLVMMAGDCRRRLKSPLPKGYFGNANVRIITDPKCVSGEVVSRPLSYAAGKIREAVGKITDEYLKSTLEFTRSQQDVSWMRSSFHMMRKQGPFLGNPNMFITTWMGLPLLDADFGWGKASYMGTGALYYDGRALILPGSDEDGSVVVALRLQTAHMSLFQNFFYQDI